MSCICGIASFIFFGWTNIVDATEIKDAVSAFVISRLDSTLRRDAVIEFRSGLESVKVSGSDHAIRIEPQEEIKMRGAFCLPVEISSDGKVERRMVVSLKVRLFGRVLVCSRQLDRHTSIADGDIASRYAELTSLPDDIILNKEQLAGKRTSRIIGEGSILKESSLELMPLVFRGESVTLLVRAGKVKVSMQATAKDDGVFGSLIEVQKIDSHERIKAVVIDDHTVQVTTE